jgi:hypothetical protein
MPTVTSQEKVNLKEGIRFKLMPRILLLREMIGLYLKIHNKYTNLYERYSLLLNTLLNMFYFVYYNLQYDILRLALCSALFTKYYSGDQIRKI